MTTRWIALGICGLLAAAVWDGSNRPVQASEATDKASAFFEKGDLRSASIELKNALQKDPNDAQARLLLGKLYLRAGNGAAAEKEIRRAIDLGTDASLWRLDFVQALILQAKFDEALQRLDAATDLSPADRTRALILRGDASIGQGRPDAARDAYTQALEADPASDRAAIGLLRITLNKGDPAASAQAADDLLTRFPNNTEALLIRAELHRTQGENEAALKLFDQVLRADTGNLAARLGHATTLIGMKDLAQARTDLDLIDKAAPDLPMTAYLRGVIEFQDKNWPKAAEHLDRVLAAAPNHIQSQLLLGIVRYSQGQMETASELLGRVVAAAPDNLQARKVLAATRIKMREPERAIELLEPVAQNADPQTRALLGSAYLLKGDPDKGQEWLSRAVEDAPDVAALRTQHALSLLAGGKTDQAIGELQSAVDLGQDLLQADVLLVLAHIKNKELDQAIAAGTALEKRRPDSPIPYNLTGLAYLAKGDYPAARARFNKALAIDPGFVTAEINLARVEVAAKDPEAAQRHFEQALKTDPKHLGALLGLAALAEQRQDGAALEAALKRANDAVPAAAQPGLLLTQLYMARGDYPKALSTATDLSRRFPDNDAVLQMQARAQTLGGEIPDAIRTFDQLLRKNPDDPQLNYLSGGAYWKNGDFPQAKAAFKRALALKPDFADAQVALASVSLDAGDTAAALETAKALQTAYPKDAVGYRVEGGIHNANREPKLAIAPLRKAFELQPSSGAVRQLAESLQKSGDEQGAARLLASWTKDHPGDLDAQAMRGLLLQQMGRPKEAIAVYESILSQTPTKNPLLLNNLAWLYREQGDARAEATAKDAYDLAPNRPEIADTYGWILYNAGKQAEGLGIMQQAYLAFPSQTEIGYHVAVALDGLGRGKEAIQILRKVLSANPSPTVAADATKLLNKLGGQNAAP